MENIKKICIFCGRTNLDTTFNREHIIPSSVGGNFYLDDCVCKICNSYLGGKVDSEILLPPDILNAFDKLNIKHHKDGIVNRNYEITGKTEDDLEFKFGKAKSGKIIFPAQKMPDDSLIVPEKDYKKNIENHIKRDKRIKDSGVSDDYIIQKTKELISLYDKLKPGEKVKFTDLGITLLKRSDKPKTTLTPKRQANLLPLISKIAYEFIFFVGGPMIFKDENIEIQEQLVDSINTGEPAHNLFFTREQSSEDDYKYLHYIMLEFNPGFTIVRVIFFGNIQFMIMLKPFTQEFKDNIESHIKMKDINRFSYQQVLDKPSKSFWVDTNHGEKTCVAWID